MKLILLTIFLEYKYKPHRYCIGSILEGPISERNEALKACQNDKLCGCVGDYSGDGTYSTRAGKLTSGSWGSYSWVSQR